MKRRSVLAMLAMSAVAAPRWSLADASEEYTQDEIYSAATGFFGQVSEGIAKAVEKVFAEKGRPNAYITGEEAAGAVVVGLLYGNGTLHRKKYGASKIYWQGPTVGFDLGANASKTFTLIYNLKRRDELYKRIPAVDGSLYFIGGVGVNYQQSGSLILAPMRTGVGYRAGVNIGYLHYGPKHSWVPF